MEKQAGEISISMVPAADKRWMGLDPETRAELNSWILFSDRVRWLDVLTCTCSHVNGQLLVAK